MLLETLVQFLRRIIPTAKLVGVAFDVENERICTPEVEWHERIGNARSSTTGSRVRQLFSLLSLLLLNLGRPFYWARWLLPTGQRTAVEALREADLVVSCPGGYLEDSNPAYILNVLQILLSCRFGKRTILAPQSVGPIKGYWGRKLLEHALHGADAVYVREKKSAEFISELANERNELTAKTHISGDLAFWYEEKSRSTSIVETLGLDSIMPILGITLVDWSFPHHPSPEQARKAYLEALSTVVKHVQQQRTHRIIVFNQVNGDLPILRDFAEQNPDVLVDWTMRGTSELSRLIGSCDVFIGTRFHSCIFALLNFVPTVAIAYLPKTTGIMADLELTDFVVDINNLSGAELISQYENLILNRSEVSARIGASVGRYKRTYGHFFDPSNFEV